MPVAHAVLALHANRQLFGSIVECSLAVGHEHWISRAAHLLFAQLIQSGRVVVSRCAYLALCLALCLYLALCLALCLYLSLCILGKLLQQPLPLVSLAKGPLPKYR